MAEKVPIIVVLGIDIDGKPHASRFEDRDAPFVLRAAELMGFHVIRVAPETEELHGVAAGLPVGKIFATGRAFVPFVRRAAFDKLATLVEDGVTIERRTTSGAEPAVPRTDMFAAEALSTADALWSKIEVGTLVLAEQPDIYGPGWWEGIVVGIDGDELRVRWRDEPNLEQFRVSWRNVALRHPGTI